MIFVPLSVLPLFMDQAGRGYAISIGLAGASRTNWIKPNIRRKSYFF